MAQISLNALCCGVSARGCLSTGLLGRSHNLLLGALRSFASQPAAQHDTTLPQMPPFNYTPAPYTGPSKEEVIALRKKYLSPGEQR
jgi:alanine-glyoxylate transaminase/(R)-3-amino-2-methylpropionate-pyruvate transaminase